MAEQVSTGAGGATPPTVDPNPSEPTYALSTNPPNPNPRSQTLFTNYAEYVQQVIYGDRIGSVGTIKNALAAGDELDTTILLDPLKIDAYRKSIADQMNKQSQGPVFEDLSDRIADIIIDTTAQGAGTLEVHLIDPMWVIPESGFISVDQTGYLWPPIDIAFPSDTDCVWRLVQYAPTWGQMTEANLVLTFEDKIASQLREMSAATGGIQQGSANQTLGGFIKQLVDSTNKTLSTNIRLVELIAPNDPNYTIPITDLPASAKKNLRTNPTKLQRGLSTAMNKLIHHLNQDHLTKFPPKGHLISISTLEHLLLQPPQLSATPPNWIHGG